MHESVLFVAPDGGRHYRYRGGARVRWLAFGSETSGRYAMCWAAGPAGDANPPHVHTREDEAFFVLAGRMTGRGGGQQVKLTPGDYLHLPREIPHQLSTDDDAPSESLMLLAPAGLETFFLKLSVPEGEGGSPAADSHDQVASLAQKFGNRLLPPEEFAVANSPGAGYSRLSPHGQKIVAVRADATGQLLTSDQTNGQYGLSDWRGETGETGEVGTGTMHALYVEKGGVTFVAERTEYEARAGSFLHASPDALVRWRASVTTRLLIWTFGGER